MSFGIKPLGSRVVIKRIEAETKTSSGLFIPDAAQEKPQMAEVLAVGPGTAEDPMDVEVGDTVIFSPYGGTEIKFEGEDVMIMNHRDIFAVVNK